MGMMATKASEERPAFITQVADSVTADTRQGRAGTPE
jgi:hypothetical protein